MPLNYAALSAQHARSRVDLVRRFVERLDMADIEARNELNALNQQDDNEDWLAEDAALLSDLEALGNELAILGLQRVAETGIRNGLAWYYKAKQPVAWPALEAALQKDFGVGLNTLTRANDLNELRLLANSIKHEDGLVSSALAAAFPNWTASERLPNLGSRVAIYSEAIPMFIEALVKLVRSKT